MKSTLIAALLVAMSLHAYAQADGSNDLDCSDYYGLNICGDGIEFKDGQITYVEESQNTFTTTLSPLFSPSLPDEDMNQIERENAFKNSDLFRNYMKSLGSTDNANTEPEFSLTKRILDNKKIDMDCRVITDRMYELSSSNYYDCTLQRHF